MNKIQWIKCGLLNGYKPFTINPNAFITTWNVPVGSLTLNSALITANNCTIDWGDGTISNYSKSNPTHTYAVAGQYKISITGQYSGFSALSSATKLIAVNQWGNVGFYSLTSAFRNCSNLISLPDGNITGVNNVNDANCCFYGCTSLTSIPSGLFNNCINVAYFNECFVYCHKLILPSIIFNLSALQNKQPNMAECFFSDSTANSPTGTIQPIWDYITITSNNLCFGNCTGIANYSSIPTLWKSIS